MIRSLILRWARNRKPDFVIGGQESPYLRRHWLIPRNRFFNIYVHEFLRSDDDRALHDHPWAFNCSWLLTEYFEHTPRGVAHRKAGDWKFRWGPAPHRVELLTEQILFRDLVCFWVHAPKPCWTVFVTGPVVREWGFHCPKGFVPWRQFVDARDAGAIGRGCD